MTRILIVTAAALTLAASASAQPAPWAPERTTAGWTFTPGAALGALWDTNVTLVNAGNAKQEEWVGIVNPRGELQYNGRHTRFNLGYSGALEAYRKFDELNRFDQRGRASFRRQISPRLQLDATANYAMSPTTDRLEIGTLPFVDIGSKTADAGGFLKVAASSRTAVETEYRFQYVRFDRDEADDRFTLLNSGHAHSPAIRVVHSLSSRLGIGAEWQYRRASLQGFDGEFGVHNVLGSASYQAGPSTTISGALGGSRTNAANTGETQWGPSIQAGITHQVRRVSATARYFRSFVPSFSFGGVSSSQQFSAGVRAPLSAGGRLSAGASTSFTRTLPVEEFGLGFQADSLTIQGTLEYQFAPWLRAEGFVTNSHQMTTASGDMDRLRVGIHFITSKPVRIE